MELQRLAWLEPWMTAESLCHCLSCSSQKCNMLAEALALMWPFAGCKNSKGQLPEPCETYALR